MAGVSKIPFECHFRSFVSNGMARKHIGRPDRYDVSGNIEAEYVDAEQTVLVNRKGITELRSLQVAEEEGLVQAYETLLGEVRLDTPLSCDLLRHIHLRIFGDLYAWAGRWRTVWIRKPGVTWPPPDFLDQNMQEFERTVLRKYPASELCDDTAFCAALGKIQGEFLVIHPFREGNARTIKVGGNLLAIQTDRPLLVYDSSAEGQEKYIAAATAAFKRNYAPMAKIVQQALDRARRGL
jgi:cell filamentation protein